MRARPNGKHRGRRLWRARRPPSRWEFRGTEDVADVRGHWREVLRALAPFGVTENEAKVAWLVAQHYESAQIAEAFGVSRSTVTAAIGRLLRVFGLRNRRQLLRNVRSLVERAGQQPGDS